MSQLTDNLNRLTELAESSFSDRCPNCGREVTDKEDIELIKDFGWCLMCDNEMADINRRNYDEVNKEVEKELGGDIE